MWHLQGAQSLGSTTYRYVTYAASDRMSAIRAIGIMRSPSFSNQCQVEYPILFDLTESYWPRGIELSSSRWLRKRRNVRCSSLSISMSLHSVRCSFAQVIFIFLTSCSFSSLCSQAHTLGLHNRGISIQEGF